MTEFQELDSIHRGPYRPRYSVAGIGKQRNTKQLTKQVQSSATVQYLPCSSIQANKTETPEGCEIGVLISYLPSDCRQPRQQTDLWHRVIGFRCGDRSAVFVV
jgi:hypothetical protein